MGGSGSGRQWQNGADTTEDYRQIDVRWLKREGMLEVGAHRQITWSRHGKVTRTITVEAELGRVILDYFQRDRAGDWQAMRYPVALETTLCHMGGARPWFLCPVPNCGRRVAILYGGAFFACRHCYQLAYPSQRETPGNRSARRANRIRAKLGWAPGILNPPSGPKPKGMHQRTYERLRWQHDTLALQTLEELKATLKRWKGEG